MGQWKWPVCKIFQVHTFRGRGDPRNIIGVIIDRSDNDMYTIAVKSGILRTKYSRNEFNICPQRLLSQSDVNQQDRVSLLQTLKSSATGGQGFVKCDCTDSKNKCGTDRPTTIFRTCPMQVKRWHLPFHGNGRDIQTEQCDLMAPSRNSI